MVLAAVQGYGVCVALQTMNMIEGAGWVSLAAPMASLVAGTAMVVVFARLIDRHGTGFGFWLIIGASIAFAFPDIVRTQAEMARTGSNPLWLPLAIDLAMALAFAAILALVFQARSASAAKTVNATAFPVMASVVLASWLTAAILSLFSATSAQAQSSSTQLLVYTLALSALLLVLLWVGLRRVVGGKVLVFAVIGLTVCLMLATVLPFVPAVGPFGWYAQQGLINIIALFAVLAALATTAQGRR
jgi:preprotein translocase subunit SecY